MPTNYGIITKPVSIDDVRKTLGNSSCDIGTLCRADNINPLSRCKPVCYPSIFAVNDEKNGIYLGTGITAGAELSPSTIATSIIPPLISTYKKPSGGTQEPFRLTDFVGYCHNAGSFAEIDNLFYEMNLKASIGTYITAKFGEKTWDWRFGSLTFGDFVSKSTYWRPTVAIVDSSDNIIRYFFGGMYGNDYSDGEDRIPIYNTIRVWDNSSGSYKNIKILSEGVYTAVFMMTNFGNVTSYNEGNYTYNPLEYGIPSLNGYKAISMNITGKVYDEDREEDRFNFNVVSRDVYINAKLYFWYFDLKFTGQSIYKSSGYVADEYAVGTGTYPNSGFIRFVAKLGEGATAASLTDRYVRLRAQYGYGWKPNNEQISGEWQTRNNIVVIDWVRIGDERVNFNTDDPETGYVSFELDNIFPDRGNPLIKTERFMFFNAAEVKNSYEVSFTLDIKNNNVDDTYYSAATIRFYLNSRGQSASYYDQSLNGNGYFQYNDYNGSFEVNH